MRFRFFVCCGVCRYCYVMYNIKVVVKKEVRLYDE